MTRSMILVSAAAMLLAACGEDAPPQKQAAEKPPADCTAVIAETQRNMDAIAKEGQLKEADKDAIQAPLDRARAFLKAGETEQCKDAAEQARALSETLLANRTKKDKPTSE